MTEVPLPVGRVRAGRRRPAPSGLRIYGWEDDVTDVGIPLAWVTARPMTDAGNAWLALSAAHAETGLVPVLLYRAGQMGEEVSGEAFMLGGGADVGLVDTMSAETILKRGWDTGDDFLDPYLTETRAPFGLEFPGLTEPERGRLPEATLRAAVATHSRPSSAWSPRAAPLTCLPLSAGPDSASTGQVPRRRGRWRFQRCCVPGRPGSARVPCGSDPT